MATKAAAKNQSVAMPKRKRIRALYASENQLSKRLRPGTFDRLSLTENVAELQAEK